ncbi:MAG: LacI family DNA-binding transcriptional regulator [Pseudomonadota bacterium]
MTSTDVANLAGVSQSVVSRVFTPGAAVSAKNTEKVREAARELGYQPNRLASAMITGKSRVIGVVVTYLENQFYPDALQRLSTEFQLRGYHILMFSAAPTQANFEQVIEDILSYQIDGLVLASVTLASDFAKRCAELDIPVAFFNRTVDVEGVTSVTSNNYKGGLAVADHLAGLGHTRIGYISGLESASTQVDRERGFRDGLRAHGLSLASRKNGNFTYSDAQAAALEMFAGGDGPEAVFVCNDHMAFAVIDALRHTLKLEVPGGVSVVGFDDVPAAMWPAYDLTTFRQPLNEMVSATVTSLVKQIENSDAGPQGIVLDGKLVVRSTTRPKA